MAVNPYVKKDYTESQSVVDARNSLQQHQQSKPAQYQSQYHGQMTDLMNQYQNRGAFQYDLNADALYQQAAQRYIQQGQQAMMDTMGQAAMLTGGYGNSYAQSVGQQTYQGYLQGLNDKIGDYYNMAIQRYQMEGDDMLNRYNMLANAENQEYARYMDDVNQYYNELNRLQGAYDTERNFDYSRYQNDENFNYGMYQDQYNWDYKAGRDSVADQQYAEQWAYQQQRDQIQDDQWQKEFDENKRRYDQEWAYKMSQAESGGGGGRGSGTPTAPTQVRTQADLASVIGGAKAAGVSDKEIKEYVDKKIPEVVPAGNSVAALNIRKGLLNAAGIK